VDPADPPGPLEPLVVGEETQLFIAIAVSEAHLRWWSCSHMWYMSLFFCQLLEEFLLSLQILSKAARS